MGRWVLLIVIAVVALVAGWRFGASTGGQDLVVERADCSNVAQDHDACRAEVREAVIEGCDGASTDAWVEVRIAGVVHTTSGGQSAQLRERHSCTNLESEGSRYGADERAIIHLPSDVSPDDAQGHVEEACRLLFRSDPNLGGAVAEARDAVRLDEKWALFYLALTDSSDGVRDWFDVGTDERVVNITCQGAPNDSAELEVKLRRPLSDFNDP